MKERLIAFHYVLLAILLGFVAYGGVTQHTVTTFLVALVAVGAIYFVPMPRIVTYLSWIYGLIIMLLLHIFTTYGNLTLVLYGTIFYAIFMLVFMFIDAILAIQALADLMQVRDLDDVLMAIKQEIDNLFPDDEENSSSLHEEHEEHEE